VIARRVGHSGLAVPTPWRAAKPAPVAQSLRKEGRDAGATINLSPGGLGASTEIRGSVILSGEDLTVAASYVAGRGRVLIDRTTLASGAGPYDRLVVYASLLSSHGLIEVTNSSLTGTEKIEIRTGDVAQTLVRGNLFSSEGPMLILAAQASPCQSRDNVPAMECIWY